MEKQTIIFTALPNGRAADGALRLSVFISPRLWDDDPDVKKMKLSQFADFLPWTDKIGAATWRVEFGGGPTLDANVVGNPLRGDLWNALFKPDTDVLPFQFNDYRGADVETFPSALINDYLAGVYVRAATDPAWKAGKDLPPLETVARDPEVRDIALASRPRPPLDDTPPRERVDLGGERPDPEPRPEPDRPRKDRGCCCLCGCLMLPFALLSRVFPPLKPLLDRICRGRAPEPDDDEEAQPPNDPVGPFPELPPDASPKPVATEGDKGPFYEPPPGPPSANRAAFDRLGKFITPFSADAHALPTAAELEEIYDFHQMVSSLGDYPGLMRMLGLVVDLIVPLGGEELPAQATVKILPGNFDDSVIVSPRTHYTLTDAGFATRPRPVDPEISNGFLRLNDAGLFRVVQVDTVGGGTKMRNTATNVCGYEKKEDRSPNMPDTTGLPALRSAGISVVRLNLEEELFARFEQSFALQMFAVSLQPEPPAPPPDATPTDELFAEDVVRGYRIDVFDSKSANWHSLCQRVGTYDFLEAPDSPAGEIREIIADEGFVQLGVTEPLEETATPRLRATDSIFVWDGWSLVAPRPGKSIMHPGDDPDEVTLEKPGNEAKTKFKLETAFEAAKRSLPRLRFDYSYKLRARVCDLAGNSVVGPGDPAEFAKDVEEQTPEFPCARFEPISPPALMLREAPVEGESLEHLVVRTPAVGGESQTTERHVIPPKVSQLMAEQHGKFDLAPGMDSSAAAYNLAAREAGALTDGATQVKKPDAAAPEKSDPWVFAGTQYAVTYLPDPSSRGALLLGLPGIDDPEEVVEPTAAKRVNKIPFDAAWPDPLPFRLRLVAIPFGEEPDEPKWEDGAGEAQRVLTVELPESEKAVVRISSYMAAEDLGRQGVHQWVAEKAPASAAQVELDTVSGRSWLHLPWREITLVHAVQKPLKPPKADVKAGKQLGESFARLSGDVTAHSASTGKVDLRAKWEDDVDDLSQPGPGKSKRESFVCQLQVAEGQDKTPILDSATGEEIKHQLGDTKYHRVTYVPTATTRFREYFPAAITDTPANISVTGPDVAEPDAAEADVLNSKRPDAPKVLYVVPTYEWEDASAPPPDTAARTRKGGGLRVYLDRPWYSSGSGELLGVVFMEGKKFLDLDESQAPHVTQWGADPIWLSPPADEAAAKPNFIAPADRASGLRLEGLADPVSVAAYAPEYDPVRRLWFADIRMTAGPSYAPFVRLALARYQPNSVQDAELSSVVRADFAQYAPDRAASVTTNPTAGGAEIHVRVTGPTFLASGVTLAGKEFWGKETGRTGSAEIEVLLQRRDPAFGSDPHLGWKTLSVTRLGDDKLNPRTWEGVVILEEELSSGTFRVLLQEYEWFRTDFAPEDAIEQAAVGRRIVYADAFPIS